MTRSPPRAVLLDLDGTLVDSVPDITSAINVMMAQFSLPSQEEARVRSWVGDGAQRLVQRALAAADAAPAEVDPRHAHDVFIAAYEQRVCEKSTLYPGALETLAALAGRGYALACVTNKPGRLARSLLEGLGVAGFFHVVAGGDSTPRRKPDPAVLRYAADNLRVALDRCLMVGDSANDVEAARAAGVTVVCVSYGYNRGGDIRAARPDAVIDDLPQLLGWLDDLSMTEGADTANVTDRRPA